VKTHTNYLTFNTKKRQEIIDITDEVEKCRAAAGINEGMVLVSAMHISASVFVNDHEPGLWKDILDWLENRIAPWSPDDYRHNSGTGEDNAAAHLRSLTIGHEVIVPVTRLRVTIPLACPSTRTTSSISWRGYIFTRPSAIWRSSAWNAPRRSC